MVVGLGGYTIYHHRQIAAENLARSSSGGVQFLKSRSKADSNLAPQAETIAESSTAQARGFAAPIADRGPASDAASAEGPVDESADKANTKGKATTEDATGAKNKVRFVFAEYSSQALDQLFEDSRASGQFNQIGDHFAGIVGGIAQKTTQNGRDIKILHQETRSLSNGSVNFFIGVHPGDPEQELGFTVFLEKQDGEGELSRGSLEITRSWRESNPPGAPWVLVRKNYPALIEMAPGSGFFLAGLLPVAGLRREDQEIISIPPFQIFRSDAFRASTSELVLFVEFVK